LWMLLILWRGTSVKGALSAQRGYGCICIVAVNPTLMRSVLRFVYALLKIAKRATPRAL
jgi:hypothetical protein